MSDKPTIAISHLTPELEGYYALFGLAKIWLRQGYRIEVGPTYTRSAHVCILHHDRTKLDPKVLPVAPTGARIVNGKVLDISKRAYSTLAVSQADDWVGPVIVKTDLNHFGVPERKASKHDFLMSARRHLARLSWRAARSLPKRSYPVLKSIADVPNWVWASPEFLVEKFLPEISGDGLYCVRGWFFFGDKSYGYRVFATNPLVKTWTMVRYEYLDDVPDELSALRRQMGFDYGKFDYVQHDGRAILLDANRTPTVSSTRESPRLLMLAEGIKAFLQ